jgi:hypothetical protein
MTGTVETTEPPRAACPACGHHTLAIAYTGWRAITRYACVEDGCDYAHDIEHPPIYPLGTIEDKRR